MKIKLGLCLLILPFLVFSATNRDEIYYSGRYIPLGNPNGLITIVDFSDYECGPCRSINRTLNYLAKNDSQVRIISIDYPMLGDNSTFAAKAAVASKYQGNYLQFHQALMTAPLPLTQQAVLALASQVGLNSSKLLSDMQNKRVLNDLLDNMLLGNSFSVKGLPTFIVGYTRAPHNTMLFTGADGQKLLQTVEQYEARLY